MLLNCYYSLSQKYDCQYTGQFPLFMGHWHFDTCQTLLRCIQGINVWVFLKWALFAVLQLFFSVESNLQSTLTARHLKEKASEFSQRGHDMWPCVCCTSVYSLWSQNKAAWIIEARTVFSIVSIFYMPNLATTWFVDCLSNRAQCVQMTSLVVSKGEASIRTHFIL